MTTCGAVLNKSDPWIVRFLIYFLELLVGIAMVIVIHKKVKSDHVIIRYSFLTMIATFLFNLTFSILGNILLPLSNAITNNMPYNVAYAVLFNLPWAIGVSAFLFLLYHRLVSSFDGSFVALGYCAKAAVIGLCVSTVICNLGYSICSVATTCIREWNPVWGWPNHTLYTYGYVTTDITALFLNGFVVFFIISEMVICGVFIAKIRIIYQTSFDNHSNQRIQNIVASNQKLLAVTRKMATLTIVSAVTTIIIFAAYAMIPECGLDTAWIITIDYISNGISTLLMFESMDSYYQKWCVCCIKCGEYCGGKQYNDRIAMTTIVASPQSESEFQMDSL